MIPMSRPAVPVELYVSWTQTACTEEVKAQQLPAPRTEYLTVTVPVKPRILAAMRQCQGRQWTQRQLAAVVGRRQAGICGAVAELVGLKLIVEVATETCTRQGAMYLYELASDRLETV